MIERRQDLRLTFEAREARGIARERLGQNLDCHVALQSCISCAVDLAHSTGTELTADLVHTEPRADRHRHRGGGDYTVRLVESADLSTPQCANARPRIRSAAR